MNNNRLKITPLAHVLYKKCECCNRVKDIFFKMTVTDSKTGNFLVGDLDLCKNCGENFGDILNITVSSDAVVTNFQFTKT